MSAHEIITDASGNRLGTDGNVRILLMDETGRMFKRCAIKAAGTSSATEINWLVVDLNGVRVYQKGLDIIVTTQDLNP